MAKRGSVRKWVMWGYLIFVTAVVVLLVWKFA